MRLVTSCSLGLTIAGWGVAFLGAMAGAPAYAQIGSIGVNFVGGDDNPPGNDASSLAIDEVAGVAPQAFWNNVAPWSNSMSRGNGATPDEVGSFSGLLDSFGLETTAGVAWNAENTFEVLDPAIDNADERLMDGYLDSSEAQPMIDINLTDIPYASYDVIVYFGSDGNNRSGSIRLNQDVTTDRFYLTASGSSTFDSSADYLEAIATVPNNARASNYVRYEGVTGDELLIQSVRGSSNSGIHGFQLIQRVAPSLLRVNRLTGQAWIVGGDVISVDLNGYEVTSDGTALALDRLRSLGSQELDAVGDTPGENWEIVYSDPQQVVEGFLLGSTELDASVSIPLGGLLPPGASQDDDIRFSYSLANGQVVEGAVEFFDGPLEGDFNGDQVVDAADYTVWRQHLGVEDESPLAGAGSGDGGVGEEDYLLWRENYGLTAQAAATEVPEPHPAILLVLATGSALISVANRAAAGATKSTA